MAAKRPLLQMGNQWDAGVSGLSHGHDPTPAMGRVCGIGYSCPKILEDPLHWGHPPNIGHAALEWLCTTGAVQSSWNEEENVGQCVQLVWFPSSSVPKGKWSQRSLTSHYGDHMVCAESSAAESKTWPYSFLAFANLHANSKCLCLANNFQVIRF